jgi:hypothetical protein
MTETNTNITDESGRNINPVLAPIFVWEFMYNDFTYESAAHTMSLHRTKKGATKAMEIHKEKVKKEWDKLYKDDPDEDRSKWKWAKWWGVRKTKVLD